MGYDTEFTDDNRAILEHCNLNGKVLVNNSAHGIVCQIAWTQKMKDLFGCEECYAECDYFMEGEPTDGTPFKVFVAKECGAPPERFSTNGHEQADGVLHYGFVFSDTDESKCIFFVIHPNSWGPFQHRFRTTSFLKLVSGGVGQAASMGTCAAAGAAMGSFCPGLGTAIGGTVGAGAGWVVQNMTPSYAGDYLRYIGP